MKKNFVISVIVPVYNAKPYLKECLNSILNQTMDRIEIICIDDGSYDGSSQILDEYADKYSTIVVVHKQNAGLVAARKEGVRLASADYIGFVDADDTIKEDMFEVMYNNIIQNNVDMVSVGIYFENREIFDKIPANIYRSEDMAYVLSEMIFVGDSREHGIVPNVYSKLYKRNILINTMKNIPEEIHLREDDCLVYSYIVKCQSIQIINKAFYYYRNVPNSDSKRMDDLFFLRANKYYLFLKQFFIENSVSEICLEKLQKNYVFTIMLGINYRANLNIRCRLEWSMPLEGNTKQRILVYGVGKRGQRLLSELLASDGIEVVGVIDKDEEKARKSFRYAFKLKDIHTIEYDKLLITIADNRIYHEIVEELIRMGVDLEKVVRMN